MLLIASDVKRAGSQSAIESQYCTTLGVKGGGGRGGGGGVARGSGQDIAHIN